MDPLFLIIIGVGSIAFSYWMKWSLYWDKKNSSGEQEKLKRIEQKIENNEKLTFNDKFYLSGEIVGKKVVSVTLILGLALIVLGIAFALIFGIK